MCRSAWDFHSMHAFPEEEDEEDEEVHDTYYDNMHLGKTY